MADSETHNLLLQYYAAWSSGDPDAVAAFFDTGCVFEDLAFGAVFEGIDGVRAFAEFTFAGAPDFRIEPTAVLVDGGSAAASWTMSGTHSGDFPRAPATGKPFTIRASSIIELRDRKIVRMTDYWNPLSLA